MRNWFIKHVPDRRTLTENRWLAPVASRLASPAIWHFNRRTIARGLALGLFAGFILPVGQIVLAVLLAASIRANILVASVATLVTNPFTFAPIYYAAYRTGSFLLTLFGSSNTSSSEAASSLLISLGAASLPTMMGLIFFAVVSSLLAFVAVHVAWRIALLSKWRSRRGD